MEKFIEVFNKLVIQSLNQGYEFAVQYGPGIAFAAALILIGWVCAVVVKKIVAKLLRALGFDVLAEKMGLAQFLSRGGFTKKPSLLVGSAFYWLILINALVMAQDAVDLSITSQFVQRIILYMPHVLIVVVFLAFGIFLSNFVGRFVERTAHLANLPFYTFIGGLARYAIIALAIIMIFEYLNISATVIYNTLLVLFVVVPLAVFLVFLTAGKDIIGNILYGRTLIREFKAGDTIETDTISGTIESIDAVVTRLKKDGQEIVVPNAELAKKVIRKKA